MSTAELEKRVEELERIASNLDGQMGKVVQLLNNLVNADEEIRTHVKAVEEALEHDLATVQQ